MKAKNFTNSYFINPITPKTVILIVIIFCLTGWFTLSVRAETTLYSPYFQTANNFWTGLGIANSDTVNPANIKIEAFSSTGESLAAINCNPTLSARGQQAINLAPGTQLTGWLKLTSSTNISGLSFFGPIQEPMYMADIPLDGGLYRDFIIPHIVQDQFWDTDIFICNPNLKPADITLKLYDGNGQLQIGHSISLVNNGSATIKLSDLVSNFSGQVRIFSTQGISAFALFRNQKNNQCCFAGINASPQSGLYQVKEELDIAYIDDQSDRHLLDIYSAVGVSHAKTVMFVPGGAWRQGDKNLYSELGRTLAGYYGITTVVINYRLSNCQDGNAIHPDHINDVADAFIWVENNIGDRGDSDQLYLFGQSAGAHLVALLLTDTSFLDARNSSISKIKGAVIMSASYDLYDLVQYPNNPLNLDEIDILAYKKMVLDAFGGYDQTTLDNVSPANFIHNQMPPMLLIDTYTDMPGFQSEAHNFYDLVHNQYPAVAVTYQSLVRDDYSDTTWQAATVMAAKEPLLAENIGHWAEVVTINTREFNSRAAKLVSDFIQQH